jgi:rhodanese-related sulfurtransferase
VNQAPAVDVSELPDAVDVHTVASIKDQDDVYVIDVREQWEYDEGHIPGVTLIPMNEVPNRLEEIPTDKDVIVTCRSGNRSGQIADYLRQIGYDNVHNMSGGIIAWEAEGYQVDR